MAVLPVRPPRNSTRAANASPAASIAARERSPSTASSTSSNWRLKLGRRASGSFDSLFNLQKTKRSTTPDEEQGPVLHIHRSQSSLPVVIHARAKSCDDLPADGPLAPTRCDTANSDASSYSAHAHQTYSERLNFDALYPASSQSSMSLLPKIPVDENLDLDPSTPLLGEHVHSSPEAIRQRSSLGLDRSDRSDSHSLLAAYYPSASTSSTESYNPEHQALPSSSSEHSLAPPDDTHLQGPEPNTAETADTQSAASHPASISDTHTPSTLVRSRSDPYAADVDMRDVDVLREIDDAIARTKDNSTTEVDPSILDEPTESVPVPEAPVELSESSPSILASQTSTLPESNVDDSNTSGSSIATADSSINTPRPYSVIEPHSPRPPSERRRSLFVARAPAGRNSLLPRSYSQPLQRTFDLSICSSNRPLPRCLEYNDIKRMKTTAHRAEAYEKRRLELTQIDSGLSTWVLWMKQQQQTILSSPSLPANLTPSMTRSRNGLSTSPPFKTGHARYEPSVEFPLRPHDQTWSKATDITNHHPTPTSFAPTNLPYPGALPHRASFGSLSSLASIHSGIQSGIQSSLQSSSRPFFSVARRASTRHVKTSNKTISNPIPLASSIEEDVPYQPRVMPASPPLSQSRQFPAPPLSMSRGMQPAGPRLSNSISTTSISSPRQPAPASFRTEDVTRMSECLPQASETDIESCLSRTNGDVMAGISLYLQEHK